VLQHLARRRPLGGIEREERVQQVAARGGEEGEFGAEDGARGAGVMGWEAEGAGVGEAAEARPGGFGGDAAEFEDLWLCGGF